MTNSETSFMDLALEEARSAAKRGEVPVGAVVSKDGKLIAKAGNQTRELIDPTAHAEILAIRMACEILQSERLSGCDIHVTLEPCAMCAGAISFARIGRLYYAASDPKGGGVEHGGCLYAQPTCHHAPEVYAGLSEGEASRLLVDFFKQKRAGE